MGARGRVTQSKRLEGCLRLGKAASARALHVPGIIHARGGHRLARRRQAAGTQDGSQGGNVNTAGGQMLGATGQGAGAARTAAGAWDGKGPPGADLGRRTPTEVARTPTEVARACGRRRAGRTAHAVERGAPCSSARPGASWRATMARACAYATPATAAPATAAPSRLSASLARARASRQKVDSSCAALGADGHSQEGAAWAARGGRGRVRGDSSFARESRSACGMSAHCALVLILGQSSPPCLGGSRLNGSHPQERQPGGHTPLSTAGSSARAARRRPAFSRSACRRPAPSGRRGKPWSHRAQTSADGREGEVSGKGGLASLAPA
jgi:hypothetical protein